MALSAEARRELEEWQDEVVEESIGGTRIGSISSLESTTTGGEIVTRPEIRPGEEREFTSCGVRKIPHLTPEIVVQAQRENPIYTIAGETFRPPLNMIQKFILYNVTREELSRQVLPYSRLDEEMIVDSGTSVEALTAGVDRLTLTGGERGREVGREGREVGREVSRVSSTSRKVPVSDAFLLFPVRCTCGRAFTGQHIRYFSAMERAGIEPRKILDVILNDPSLHRKTRIRYPCCSTNFITPTWRSYESGTISKELEDHYLKIDVQRIPTQHLPLTLESGIYNPVKIPASEVRKQQHTWMTSDEARKRIKRRIAGLKHVLRPTRVEMPALTRTEITAEEVEPIHIPIVADIEGIGITDITITPPATVSTVTRALPSTVGMLATELLPPAAPTAVAGPIDLTVRRTRAATPKQMAEVKYSQGLHKIYLGPDNVYQAI